jgi:O-antigen ligase
LKPLIVYWYLTHQVHLPSVYKNGIYIITAALVLESLVAVIQVIKQGPIGSVLELAPDYIPYDTSSDSGQIFRPVGTFYHANTLAHFLLPLLFLVLPFFFVSLPGIYSRVVLSAGIIGLGTFFLTQSRSAWISFFIGFVLYLGLIEKVWRLPLILTKEAKRVITWFIIPIALVTLVFVVPRILRTSYTLDRYGSFQTRILLLEEAGMASREHPVFGVGLEMDLFFMYLRSVQRRVTNGVVFFFPEPVHNGYMRLFLQVGLVGTAGFVTASIFIVRMMQKKSLLAKNAVHRHIMAGAVSGITAIAINSTMQPLVPNLHDILLFIILSGACYYQKKSSTV